MVPVALFFLLSFFALIFVFAPLRRSSRQLDGRSDEWERVRSEKEGVVQTIRELDFDFQSGKLSEVDYRITRERAEERGIDLLRRLDELATSRDRAALESEIALARKEILREGGDV